MGAVPVALLVGFAVPADVPVAWAQDLVSGIAAECARTGATIVGGDVSGADTIMLAVTALGDLAGREPVTRGGARPGDVLAVAGVLGHSAAGLALLVAGLAEPAALVAAYRWPRPLYQAGPEAAAIGATSMIDVSDGLVADVGHVAQASGVLIDIDTARLQPGDDQLTAAARLDAAAPAGLTEPAGPAAACWPCWPRPSAGMDADRRRGSRAGGHLPARHRTPAALAGDRACEPGARGTGGRPPLPGTAGMGSLHLRFSYLSHRE